MKMADFFVLYMLFPYFLLVQFEKKKSHVAHKGFELVMYLIKILNSLTSQVMRSYECTIMPSLNDTVLIGFIDIIL